MSAIPYLLRRLLGRRSPESRALHRAARYVERGWCQHDFAEDERGLPVPASAEAAVRWCLLGAIHRATDDVPGALARDCVSAVARAIGRGDITAWNDDADRRATEVAAALRRAAEVVR